jgi:hypothetical protein
MPFVTPTLSDSFGSRWGTTSINGSLNPTVEDGGIWTIGADIGAGPPVGVITTTTSSGFDAGFAPPGATSLIASAVGVTDEEGQTFAAGPGNSASADASLYVTIEEFEIIPRLRAPDQTGAVSRERETVRVPFPATLAAASRLVRTGSFDNNPRDCIHIWSAVLGLQFLARTFEVVSLVEILAPITPGRFYRCWFNAVQSAVCHAETGPGGARCHFFYGIDSAFFAFS